MWKKLYMRLQEANCRLTLTMPEIWIEPGRSLVGDAGTTLYTSWFRKRSAEVYENIWQLMGDE